MKFSTTKLSYLALALLFFAGLGMNAAWSRDLHMFIIAQADDPAIYSAKDKVKMERLAEEVSVSTGMILKKHYFDKASLTVDRLKNEIAQLNCGSDDVIWFYYSGHGADFDGRWPMFGLGNNNDDAVGLPKIHEKLKSKGARLTLTMFDCCNHGTGIVPRGAVRPEGLATVYATLFVKSTGSVMICSSKQGQYSIGIGTGGVFTSSFISCLNRMQDASNISWDALVNDVKKETRKTANSLTSSQIQGNCNPGPDGRCDQLPDAEVHVNSDRINGGRENSYAPEENVPTKVVEW